MSEQQPDEGHALALQHSSLLTLLKAIPKIKDADQYKQVVAWRAVFDSGIKFFSDLYDERIAEAYRHWKALIKDRDGLQRAAKEGWAIGGELLVDYDREQIMIAARKQRAEEQAKEAEKQRLVNLAKEMEQPELANEIESRPVEPTVITKGTPKVQGVSYRTDWHWELDCGGEHCVKPEDFETTHRPGCPGGRISIVPEEYKMLDDARISKVVAALKQSHKIPGIRAYWTRTTIQRRS